jgi:hypothetical protein
MLAGCGGTGRVMQDSRGRRDHSASFPLRLPRNLPPVSGCDAWLDEGEVTLSALFLHPVYTCRRKRGEQRGGSVYSRMSCCVSCKAKNTQSRPPLVLSVPGVHVKGMDILMETKLRDTKKSNSSLFFVIQIRMLA